MADTTAGKGKGKDKDKWSRHPTGCATSGWRDGYDATRAALLPQVITDAVSTSESTGADFAAVFATANCVMFAATRNPLGQWHTLQLAVMADTAGQAHALSGSYGRHRRPLLHG